MRVTLLDRQFERDTREERGRRQTNFNTWPLLRMNEGPAHRPKHRACGRAGRAGNLRRHAGSRAYDLRRHRQAPAQAAGPPGGAQACVNPPEPGKRLRLSAATPDARSLHRSLNPSPRS